MNLRRKLEAWQAEGLLTPEAARGILAHEEARQRPYALYAMGALGALAVATGLVAIIASNWEVIPAAGKIGLDLLLVLGVSAGIVASDARRSAWVRETLLVVQYGLVLASIGLVAQVYQLGGATFAALLAWSALTFPLMAFGESAAVSVIWLLGLHVTAGAALGELAERRDLPVLAASLGYLIPLACLGAARARRIAEARPRLEGALRAFGWAGLALAASLGPLGFYEAWNEARLTEARGGAALAGLATALLVASPSRRPAQVVLASALVATFLPFLLPRSAWPVAAPLLFVAFWAAVGWAGHATREARILNLATAMIGLRILVAYFELFGSLMSTGLGLITGGALTLLVTYAWVRKSRDFQRALGPAAGEGAAP